MLVEKQGENVRIGNMAKEPKPPRKNPNLEDVSVPIAFASEPEHDLPLKAP